MYVCMYVCMYEMFSLMCDSPNIIHLITCSYCFMKYVGETAQNIKTKYQGCHR